MTWVHRLLSKDVEAMVGVCASCGPVQLARKSGGVRCREAKLSQRHGNDRGFSARMTATLLANNPCCPICGDCVPLVRDHDHATNSPRGLICDSCNKGLGFFRDSPQRLLSAVRYLASPPAQT